MSAEATTQVTPAELFAAIQKQNEGIAKILEMVQELSLKMTAPAASNGGKATNSENPNAGCPITGPTFKSQEIAKMIISLIPKDPAKSNLSEVEKTCRDVAIRFLQSAKLYDSFMAKLALPGLEFDTVLSIFKEPISKHFKAFCRGGPTGIPAPQISADEIIALRTLYNAYKVPKKGGKGGKSLTPAILGELKTSLDKNEMSDSTKPSNSAESAAGPSNPTTGGAKNEQFQWGF